MAVGEAILFFNQKLAEDTSTTAANRPDNWRRRCASSRRPGLACWSTTPGSSIARHANYCAQLLAELVSDIPGVELMFPVQANGVFLQLSEAAVAALTARGWRFYTFIGKGGARFIILEVALLLGVSVIASFAGAAVGGLVRGAMLADTAIESAAFPIAAPCWRGGWGWRPM